METQFQILGPLEVRAGTDAPRLGGRAQRTVLAILLLNANELVPTDRLVAALWGDERPDTAVKMVQVYVSRLRKALGRGVILTRPTGYELRIERDELDLHRFERLVREGRSALASGDPHASAAILREALALWHGSPLADLAFEPFAQIEIVRLEELRVATIEDCIEADLIAGRSAELVPELEAVVARNPLRERLRAQLMLALYRSGRQADALDVYRSTRQTLVEELGIEPGRELRDLERAILAQDPALQPLGAAASPAGPPRRPVEERAREMPHAAGVFVGRERELGQLLVALERALSGRGGLVLLSGEPGIGKTRLADEYAAHARDRGARVLVGRSWEAGGAPAYWPWAPPRACIRDAEPNELGARLGRGAPDLIELLPELLDLVPGLERAPVHDPDGARFRLFDAATEFLRETARERPLALVLDDLHAADEPTLLLLRFLAGVLADAPLMVLAVYRDTELAESPFLEAVLPDLARVPTTHRVELQGLAREDVARLVEASTGRAPTAGIVAQLHTRTEGNSLFVTEIVRLLEAEGGLETLEEGRVISLGVPQGVRDVIGRRLARLSGPAHAALSLASAIGIEFEVETLARLPDLQGRDTIEALDESIVARLLSSAGGSAGRLRFSHGLVREELYRALSPSRKSELHGLIGQALEVRHRYDLEPHLAELAHHFLRAAQSRGAVEKAVEYAVRAASRASAQLAFEEAVRLYELALDAFERRDSSEEATHCELLLALGDAQTKAGTAPDYKESFVRAAELARNLGTPEQLGRAALGYGGRFVWGRAAGDQRLIPMLDDALAQIGDGDSALRARLLARLAGALRDQTSREPRASLSHQAVEIARRLGDTATLTYALTARHMATWSPDNVNERLAMATEMFELAERSGELEPKLLAHNYRLYALFELGDLAAVRAMTDTTVRLADEIKQPAYWWDASAVQAMVALLLGHFADAEHHIARAYAFGGRTHSYAAVAHGLQMFALRSAQGRAGEITAPLEQLADEYPTYPVVRCALASLYCELGRVADARAVFEVLAAGDFRMLNRDEEWLLCMSLLASTCAFLADTRRAAMLYESLGPYAARNASGAPEFATGSVSHSLGLLAMSMERWDEAIGHLERAIAMNEHMGAQPWVARAEHDAAAAFRARDGPGDRAKADELVQRAATIFGALGMNVWERRTLEFSRSRIGGARARFR